MTARPHLSGRANLRLIDAYTENSIGMAVAKRPQKKMPKPASLSPAMNVGPELIPTTAMKTLRPTEFMNQSVGCGTLPICGFTVRSQPTTIPAMRAPPEVLSVIGTPPIGST